MKIIYTFKESKGENGGIAPLDEQGKVPSRHLPGYIDDVVDFYGLPLLGIHAQDFTVTGKVVDNTGLEVIGANISIKGSAGVGTITNIDGQYTLKVELKAQGWNSLSKEN